MVGLNVLFVVLYLGLNLLSLLERAVGLVGVHEADVGLVWILLKEVLLKGLKYFLVVFLYSLPLNSDHLVTFTLGNLIMLILLLNFLKRISIQAKQILVALAYLRVLVALGSCLVELL